MNEKQQHVNTYIHDTSINLLREMLNTIDDKAIQTPEEESWCERAENLLSYDEYHYKGGLHWS